jgi:hypothetical protein
MVLILGSAVLLIDGNNITGGADWICNDDTVNITYFVSDCLGPVPEIECDCCQLCCNDNNVTCNNFDWHVNLDPIWEYGYSRVNYEFSQELLPTPLSSSKPSTPRADPTSLSSSQPSNTASQIPSADPTPLSSSQPSGAMK